MSFKNDGSSFYVHLKTRNDWRGMSICGSDWMNEKKLVIPLVRNLPKITCPCCKVIWDCWCDNGFGVKPMTSRRLTAFKKVMAAKGIVFEPPPPPEDRPVKLYVYGSAHKWLRDSKGNPVAFTIPANATPEEKFAAEEAARATALKEKEEASQKKKEADRVRRLENKRALVVRYEKLLGLYTKKLKRARRSLGAMERAAERRTS